MKKKIVLFTCLVLALVFVLGACQTPEKETGDSSASGTSTVTNGHGGYDEASGKYYVKMPELNLSKTEFNVLVVDNTKETTYFSEEVGVDKYETTDKVLEEAVRNRNNTVYEKYGVTIKAVYTSNVATDLSNDVKSNSGAYDMAMPFLTGCVTLAQSGEIYELTSEPVAEYIDLSMPWWDQNATESFSIDHKVYFTTGDISIMQKIVSIAMAFNKTMLKDYFPDTNMYQMVKDGKWTLDKLVEMSKLIAKDSDGDGDYTYKDMWGMTSAYGNAIMLYLAAGEKLITKNQDDIPLIALDSERAINVSQKVLTLLQQKNEWVINCQDYKSQVENMWQTSLDIFGENRALFAPTAFSAIKKLRNYKDGADFGLIPLPKFEETQDKYYTPCSATMAYGVVIPKSAPDVAFSAYMTEVMACEAKNYITNAYYETILKSRDLKDSESEEMLDKYIFNNVVYDLGVIYNFGSVSSMITDLMSGKSTNIASMLESKKDAINAAIESTVEKYRNLQ